MNRLFPVLLLIATCVGCTQSDTPHISSDAWVRNVGSRIDVMQGSLGGRIALDSLAAVPNLYAVGPVEGLQGEVTIYDGEAFISTYDADDDLVNRTGFSDRAIFLVYGSASAWDTLRTDRPLDGLDQVEAYIRTSAEQSSRDLDTAFPFRIEGRVDSLQLHVIYKADDAPHNMAEHKKAKRPLPAHGADARIIGFWSTPDGEGTYTHPGKRTHLHAIADGIGSGHIDDLLLPTGTLVLLPR